jgi:hypothetical protein
LEPCDFILGIPYWVENPIFLINPTKICVGPRVLKNSKFKPKFQKKLTKFKFLPMTKISANTVSTGDGVFPARPQEHTNQFLISSLQPVTLLITHCKPKLQSETETKKYIILYSALSIGLWSLYSVSLLYITPI